MPLLSPERTQSVDEAPWLSNQQSATSLGTHTKNPTQLCEEYLKRGLNKTVWVRRAVSAGRVFFLWELKDRGKEGLASS